MGFSNRRFGYGAATFGYGGGRISRSFMDGITARNSLLGLWSTARRTVSSYSGAVLRARRSSDNAEKDFYPNGPQGEVSTADVRAWNGWNTLVRTNQFNSVWSQSRATASLAVGVSAPSELGSEAVVYEVVSDLTASSTHRIFQASQVTPVDVNGQVWTGTVWLKKTNSKYATVRINNSTESGNRGSAYINFDDGTLTVSVGTGVVTALDNGWFRVSITATMQTGDVRPSLFVHVNQDTSTTITFNGDGVSSYYIAGAQLERASSFSTYEPRTTTGAGDSFLVTLYDQSGLARNFTQSTTTLQPIICEQGVPITENGRLAGKYVAADSRRLAIPSSTAIFNALHTTGGTVLAVSQANDTAATKTLVSNRETSATPGVSIGKTSAEQFTVIASRQDVAGVATNGNTLLSTHSSANAIVNCIQVIEVDCDNATASARSKVWQDGVLVNGNNSTTANPFIENSTYNITIGANPTGTSPHDGTISEVALFSALISTADRVTLEDRAGDFYGVAVTQPITITTQPTSLIASPGQSFTLTCVGTNVQTYNWQFRNAGDTAWSAVGVQTSSLTVTATDEMAGREYRCVLINPNASATSNTATITIEQLALTGLSITSSLGGAWSASRKLLPTHSTAVIRVRRDSDNAETDLLGVGARGEVDTSAVRAFNGWNLLTRSEDFSHGDWSGIGILAFGAGSTANAIASPDGSLTADYIREDTANSTHQLTRSITIVAGITWTISCCFKAAERSVAVLAASTAGGNGARVFYNVSNGTVASSSALGTGSLVSSSIVSLGDGWYRCILTGVADPAGTSLSVVLGLTTASGTTSYLGDGASGLYLWGAQLERASSFSTYEPRTTTGAGSSFLVTKYDQTGQARHFTQATTTLQPIVCEQGVPVTEGGRLSAKYVAADARRLSIPSSTAMFNYLHTTGASILAVSRANDTAAVKAILNSNNGTSSAAGINFLRNANEAVFFQTTRLAGPATGSSIQDTSIDVSTSQSILAIAFDPDNATANQRLFGWQNGSVLAGFINAETGTPEVENAANNMTLGAYSGGTQGFDGTISEAVIASDLISTSDRDAWESRTGSFFGVSVS